MDSYAAIHAEPGRRRRPRAKEMEKHRKRTIFLLSVFSFTAQYDILLTDLPGLPGAPPARKSFCLPEIDKNISILNDGINFPDLQTSLYVVNYIPVKTRRIMGERGGHAC